MKITKITYSKLVSWPGYNNETHGAEAIVQNDENPDDVRTDLIYFVDNIINKRKAAHEAKYFENSLEVPF